MIRLVPRLLKNRTTVRSIPIELRAVRLVLGGLTAIAPRAAGALGAKLFFRPRRSSRATPPVVSGRPARGFTVETRAGRLAAWNWGSGPAVLLVHGWEGWAGQLARFVEPLLAAGLRSVAFDLPAHGSSTGRSATALDFACAIGRVARHCGPIHGIIAHSLGGTATGYALAEGLRAERVVLLAPGSGPTYFAHRVAGHLGLSQKGTEAMLRGVLQRIGGAWVEYELPNLVRGLAVPMLLMHDPADPEVPFEHGRAIANAWPGARLEPIEGLGHRRLLGDAEVIRRAVGFVIASDLNSLPRAV
jgi:pimeloyl-ACP methyl ester carboxylesterase